MEYCSASKEYREFTSTRSSVRAGIAARLKPNPTRIRMLNVIAHFVFGLAMYGIARLIA